MPTAKPKATKPATKTATSGRAKTATSGRATSGRRSRPDPENVPPVPPVPLASADHEPNGNILPHDAGTPGPDEFPTEDDEFVKETLRGIMRDALAPAAAKAQAARTLAEMLGLLGRTQQPPAKAGKPLGEMTREELEQELAGELRRDLR